VIRITEDHPWQDVAIRQHGRGGVLAGSVTDKISGKRVDQAQLQYTDLDRNGSGGTALINGAFQIAVPSDTDLVIIVMAHGYRGWVYTNSNDSSRPTVRVRSGERKRLEIELEPMTSSAAER
jgi:hypothetical protein